MVSDRGGAPVYPAQCTAFFEKCQVAADGLSRNSEAADQLIRADRLGGAYCVDDRLMALNRQHG